MGVVDDVYAYLETEALAGGVTAWGLVRRRESDSPHPDQLVIVTEDGGPPPEIGAASGIGDAAMKDVGVQVMVRAGPWDSDASRAKAQAILDALHSLRATEIGSVTYTRVRALAPEPVFLGFSTDGRPRHTVSFRLLSDL